MDDLRQWERAGKLAAEALEYGRKLIKKGESLLKASNLIDQKILDLGGRPAWPSQISCNETAAHYCADPDDSSAFQDQVASLDVGVHLDGFIGDNACTVDLSGSHSDLLKASEEALNNAIKIIRPGTKVREIGKVIESTIAEFNLKPIYNLSGHGISRWIIHDKPSIPNYDNKDNSELKEGQIIAIEPFATTGTGMIEETDKSNLFSLANKKPVRSPYAREILSFVEKEFNNLPFTTRWLSAKFGLGKTNLALKELLRLGILESHPPLVEKTKGLVSVFEKTVLVGDKTKILTKSE